MQSSNRERASSALKTHDAPAEVVLVDPITLPIARLLATWRVHPLTITTLAFLFRISAALLFASNHLELGAVSGTIGFYLDGIDGKITRIRHMDEALYGTVDFLLDQAAFAFIGVGAIAWATKYGHYHSAILLGSWLAVYMLLMAITSTWFRLLSEAGIIYRFGVYETVFEESVHARRNGHVLSVIRLGGRLFLGATAKLEPLRMMPYFGTIESEILVFMLAPLWGFNSVLLIVAILCLLPDMVMRSGLCLLHLTGARSKD